jgi:hypothetical protein
MEGIFFCPLTLVAHGTDSIKSQHIQEKLKLGYIPKLDKFGDEIEDNGMGEALSIINELDIRFGDDGYENGMDSIPVDVS